MASTILSASTLSALAPQLDLAAPCGPAAVLRVVDRGLTAVQDLGLVGTPSAPLRRLDVSNNALLSLAGLSGPLTWLQANNNRLRGRVLVDVNSLPGLSFLVFSGNQSPPFRICALHDMASPPCAAAEWHFGSRLGLIVAHLTSLTTLVCSHNLLEDVSAVGQLVALQKLSAGHNRIAKIPLI